MVNPVTGSSWAGCWYWRNGGKWVFLDLLLVSFSLWILSFLLCVAINPVVFFLLNFVATLLIHPYFLSMTLHPDTHTHPLPFCCCISPFIISCCHDCLLFPFFDSHPYFCPRSSPCFASHCSTTDPRPSTTRSASWSARRLACCSPFWCPSSGSSSACAAAATTAAARCTNARGRTLTVGAACWERCSSPPHWSSRECDTRVFAHTARLRRNMQMRARWREVHESRVRGFKHWNYSNGKICGLVRLNAGSCKVTLHTHTHTPLVIFTHTDSLGQISPPIPHALLYLVKSCWW